MKNIPLLAAFLIATAIPLAAVRADEEAAAPIFSGTIKSYESLAEFVSTVAKVTDPRGEAPPLAELDLLLAANPDAINTTKPAHAAVWLNGMFAPLVAIYVPTDDFDALKKLTETMPDDGSFELEKLDGYGLFIVGGEASLEVNLAAARAIDTAEFKADHPIQSTVRFDKPTRTMIIGLLAMGRDQVMEQSEQLGDEQTVEMMKAVLPLYFDAIEGFVAGMEETTLSLDIVDKGLRYSVRSTAKEGTTYAKLIAKSPMDPAPISTEFRSGNAFSLSARMGKMDDAFASTLGKMISMGMKINGDADEDAINKSVDAMVELMGDMTPMYMSLGYDFDGQLAAGGTYYFPESKDVPAMYEKLVRFAAEMGPQMSGEGKIYKDFKHETVTENGLEIDRFSYTMGDDFPPNPIMGDKMELEYALSGDRMLFAMGGDGVFGLLTPRESPPLPEFLEPGDATVMIGHLDILSLLGSFATLEVSHELESPALFIADKKEKPGKKKGDSKILMRADLDGALNFDLHIPLVLFGTLSRMQ